MALFGYSSFDVKYDRIFYFCCSRQDCSMAQYKFGFLRNRKLDLHLLIITFTPHSLLTVGLIYLILDFFLSKCIWYYNINGGVLHKEMLWEID